MTTHTDLTIGPPNPTEVTELAAVLGLALHFPVDGAIEWITLIGVEHFRVVRRQGRIIAGLCLAPMGQWFGGRRIPMVGFSGVGVAPEWRGRGVGITMLRAALEELHATHVPLATLYPATLTYYQRAGFARAGQRLSYELPLASIDVFDRTLELTPVEVGQYEEFYRAYGQQAQRMAGNLDRPAWMWQRRLEPKDKPTYRYLVTHNDQTEGYVVFYQGGRTDPLTVIDLCILTAAAGRRILTLFADYRSMVDLVLWNGGPLDPLRYLLNEDLIAGMRPKVQIRYSFDWMLRIVNVSAALSARGYPLGINDEFHFDIDDDWIPANNGRFVLTVTDGQGHVAPGGQGRIRLNVRELAMLYSGFMHPAELGLMGTITAPAADLALVGALFAGPRPGMADIF